METSSALTPSASGPLRHLKVLEFAAAGPVPFCAMMLADAGADVIQIGRPVQASDGKSAPGGNGALSRGRRTLNLDLKNPRALAIALKLAARSDVVLEGFRPGVMERLGLGPQACLAANPRLIYGRMTGWGQDGPLSQVAGHDINFIALSGALHAIGTAEQPIVPLNMLGDFGGGGMLLAYGVMAAYAHAVRTGEGQVIDCAMSDGAGLLMAPFYSLLARHSWADERESNRLDGGAPYYRPYRCQDGKYVAIGAIEPAFFACLLTGLGIEHKDFGDREDRAQWPAMRRKLEQVFVTRTQEQWCEHFDGTDACLSPVMAMSDVPAHPHHVARHSFIDVDDECQPSPAPRFSRTPCSHPESMRQGESVTNTILSEAGFSDREISELRTSNIVA